MTQPTNEQAYQAKLWSFYQNTNTMQVFADAGARHAALLRAATRLTAGRKGSLLNIGIGDGNLERQALAQRWQVASLDPDSQAAARLCQEGIDAQAGSITALPFEDARFDIVIATEVLEHLSTADRARGLHQIWRTLRPGAYLLGTVPNREVLEQSIAVCPCCSHVFHRWGHTTSFDVAKLREELSTQFTNVDCRVTAFVDFHGKPLSEMVKNVLRWSLAKLGSSWAWSNILFRAQKHLNY